MLIQNFSPITYPSEGIRWLLCEYELVTIPARTRTIKALNSKLLRENDPANLRLYMKHFTLEIANLHSIPEKNVLNSPNFYFSNFFLETILKRF